MKYKTNQIYKNLKTGKAVRDIIIIASILLFFLILSLISNSFGLGFFDLSYIRLGDLIELIIVTIILITGLIVFAARRWIEFKRENIKRMEIERRMYKSRSELQAVLDGVPDMIMQLDLNLRILWANQAVITRNPNAIGLTTKDAFALIGESVIETYCKWAMATGTIEKGIKYQTSRQYEEGGTYWEGIGIPLKTKDDEIYGTIAIARDVTERMRLEHTSNLLASIIESTDDAIYGMTFDSTVLSWNDGAEKTYNFKAQDIVGNKSIITVPVDQREEYLSNIEKVIRTQEILRYETIRYKNGDNPIYVTVTLCPFVDATGRKIGVSAIDRDITKRKKAEMSLIESETRYRELFENMSSGVVVYRAIHKGEDFVIKDFNTGAEIIEDVDKNQMISKKCSQINNPEVLELIKKVYKSGKPKQKIITISKKNKNDNWQDIRIYKLPSGEIVSIFDDITERIIAEDSLIKSEEKFRTLVNTAPDGIVMVGADGIILEVNQAFAKIFVSKREDVIGTKFVDLFDKKKSKLKALRLLEKSTTNASIEDKEISTILKNKESINVELSVAHLQDDDGKPSAKIVITRDISIRKKYEYDLKDSQEQLRNLAIHLQTAREEERKNIAFEIHDELGYALTALKLDLAWVGKKMDIKEESLITKSKSMAELIDTTINKVRSISTQLRPSILDHFGLIAAIEWQANEFQKRTAIRCKLNIEDIDFKFNDHYATAMFRIFQETLTNVARHAKASRVDVSFMKIEDQIELIVRDNGIGLPIEQLDNHKSLGLIGIRERAKSLGGNVVFNSQKGDGTTLILTVPFPKTKVLEND